MNNVPTSKPGYRTSQEEDALRDVIVSKASKPLFVNSILTECPIPPVLWQTEQSLENDNLSCLYKRIINYINQPCISEYVFTQPLHHEQNATQGQFLSSEFRFLLLDFGYLNS